MTEVKEMKKRKEGKEGRVVNEIKKEKAGNEFFSCLLLHWVF
jgi:hypothetical protein